MITITTTVEPIGSDGLEVHELGDIHLDGPDGGMAAKGVYVLLVLQHLADLVRYQLPFRCGQREVCEMLGGSGKLTFECQPDRAIAVYSSTSTIAVADRATLRATLMQQIRACITSLKPMFRSEHEDAAEYIASIEEDWGEPVIRVWIDPMPTMDVAPSKECGTLLIEGPDGSASLNGVCTLVTLSRLASFVNRIPNGSDSIVFDINEGDSHSIRFQMTDDRRMAVTVDQTFVGSDSVDHLRRSLLYQVRRTFQRVEHLLDPGDAATAELIQIGEDNRG